MYAKSEIALGEIDQAISAWQQWLKAHPVDPRAMELLGSLEEIKGNQAMAMDYYKKTLQFDPNSAVASNNLAYLMVQSGENADVALTLAQTARRGMPDAPETADTLAWVYYYKSNYTGARDLLEDALKTHPNDASMQLHLGLTDSKLDDKANAELHLKKAVSLVPANSKIALDANDALEHLK